MAKNDRNSRLPRLIKAYVNNSGDVCLLFGKKEVKALQATVAETHGSYVKVLSYLDFAHNVLYYHLGNDTLLLRYTNDAGKTESWLYKRNNSDGVKFMGFRLNDEEFKSKLDETSID